jgi:1-deoxy-D-xylulose-5-phosphate synthase
MQRSYDQIFQEVALQNLPVILMMDRGGLAGPDGPTHHGVFDIGYMRVFPNITFMAPGDGPELQSMLDFAVAHNGPTAIRYPKASAPNLGLSEQPIEYGKAQIVRWGTDGAILALGPMLETALKAAEQLAQEGLEVAVINPRFIKPLDEALLAKVFAECRFVITAEEAALMGGFGSAVTELAVDRGWDTRNLRRLGIPDRFIEHGERDELLADLGMSLSGMVQTCHELAARTAAQQVIG